MSSESSAVVRFIQLAQQQRIDSGPVFGESNFGESTVVVEPNRQEAVRWVFAGVVLATALCAMVLAAGRYDLVRALSGGFDGEHNPEAELTVELMHGVASGAAPGRIEPEVVPLVLPSKDGAPTKPTAETAVAAQAAPAVSKSMLAPSAQAVVSAAKPVPKKSAHRRARKSRARAATPAASEVVGDGVLLLGSKPPCDIYIDGKSTGLKTPQRSIELPAGPHTITLINREFGIKDRFSVKVAAGKTTRKIRDLSDHID